LNYDSLAWYRNSLNETSAPTSESSSLKFKPVISLVFKSDKLSKKILDFKNKLPTGDKFNIVFKSQGKLADVALKLRRKRETGVFSTAAKDIGVVYLATCKSCKIENDLVQYIGETGRLLSTRIKEHCRHVNDKLVHDLQTSALGNHCLTKHGSQPSAEFWDVEILQRSSRTQDRRALEAREIARRRPVLNRDAGIHVLNFNASAGLLSATCV